MGMGGMGGMGGAGGGPSSYAGRRGQRGRDSSADDSGPDDGLVINAAIRADEVRLLGQDKAMLGVMRLGDALALAADQGVDVVLVSPDAKPPVARLVSASKYRFEAARAATEARDEDASLRTALTDAIEGTAATTEAAAAEEEQRRERGAAATTLAVAEGEPAAAETLRRWTARAPEARRVEAAIVLTWGRD